MWASAQWRRRWAALVVAGLVLALTGAVAMAAATGARRAVNAFDRLREATSATDVAISEISDESLESDPLGTLGRLLPLVGATGATFEERYFLRPIGSDLVPLYDIYPVAAQQLLDLPANVPVAISGRLPRPTEASEIALSEHLAEVLRLRPGDRLTLESASMEWVERLFAGGGDPEAASPDGRLLDMVVTGIVVSPLDFIAPVGVIYLTPAFADANRDEIANFPGADIRLADEARARRMVATGLLESGDPQLDAAISMSQSAWGAGQDVSDGLRIAAIGLWVFCTVAAFAGLAAGLLLVRRLARSLAAEFEVLGALGLDRPGRAAYGLALVTPTVAIGTVGAVFGAIVLKPYARIGLADQVEPDRGRFVDWRVLTVGVVILAVVGFAGAARPFIAGERRSATSGGQTRFPRVGRPLAMTLGVRHALGGRTDQAPSHATVAVGACLMTTAIASLAFGASVVRLPEVPASWGGGSDVVMDFGEGQTGQANEPYEQALRSLANDDRVSAVTGMTRFSPEIDGLLIWSIALDSRRGEPIASVLAGRVPRSPDEIGLGRGTMRRLGVDLDDEVSVTLNGTTEMFRLVGQIAFPIGETTIDEGAAISATGSRRFPGFADAIEGYQGTLAWDAGVDAAVATAELVAGGYPVLSPRPPPVVRHLGQVDRLPGVLALFFAVLGLAAVAYLLSVAGRARRRERAVLTALGLPPRHGAAVLCWQAATVSVIATVVGIPAGIILGRAVYAAVAQRAGVVVSHSLPASGLALAAVVAIGGSLVPALVLAAPFRRRPVAENLRAD